MERNGSGFQESVDLAVRGGEREGDVYRRRLSAVFSFKPGTRYAGVHGTTLCNCPEV